MAVFSDVDIVKALGGGDIVCQPFNKENLGSSSLDITLGRSYFRVERFSENPIYNPYDREEVERYFDGPFEAISHQQWCKLNHLTPIRNIPLDHPVISLKPGERILAHSHEFIGLKNCAMEVKCHTSWSRNGIVVNIGSNWIEPGFVNRVTIEIININQDDTILLPVGSRIAKLVFYHLSTTPIGEPFNKIQTVMNEWSPDQMLPKLYQIDSSLTQNSQEVAL